MNRHFNEVKKNFGFGFMRLPLLESGEVNYEETCKMTDDFLQAGFNYFDTAHGYLKEKSEIAIRECLTKRYPREKYVLADKLTETYFKKEEDIKPFFESQLEACGVEYFDFYLMHAQNAENYKQYKECKAYEVAGQLKKEGKIRHLGFSFHDKPAVLDMILSEHPEIEFVQIQFNYVDFDDAGVQSRECYEVCRKHNKPIIIMEPVKGGSLVDLPKKAEEVFDSIRTCSNAGYAIRFAAGFDGVFMVLSGMSNTEQMNDNLSFMKDFEPLSETEAEAVEKVREIFRLQNIIPCTTCRYCVDGCPKKISIPDLFSCMNARIRRADWPSEHYYHIHTRDAGKASDCIECGKCEKACPQHLEIRKLLKQVAAEFEKEEA